MSVVGGGQFVLGRLLGVGPVVVAPPDPTKIHFRRGTTQDKSAPRNVRLTYGITDGRTIVEVR